MKPNDCPCGCHETKPPLAMCLVVLDPTRPKETTRAFADLHCPSCRGTLVPTSRVAERYGRCASRCGDQVWWHDGERLQPVSPTGREFLRYVGIE